MRVKDAVSDRDGVTDGDSVTEVVKDADNVIVDDSDIVRVVDPVPL